VPSVSKPRKVEKPVEQQVPTESPNTPIQVPPADFKPRYADAATAKACMEKVFRVHGDLLRKLAEYDRNG
jgi:hypothetical protein